MNNYLKDKLPEILEKIKRKKMLDKTIFFRNDIKEDKKE